MTDLTRQAARTQAAIQAAFAELIFTKRYPEIRMTDVARSANVGRSTLYQHYKDKDAILLANMAPVLAGLAKAISGAGASGEIAEILSHIWSHRDRGRVVLFGATGQKLENALASQVSEALSNAAGAFRPALSSVFVANQVAASVFSILRTWLAGEASAPIPALARHICLCAEAQVAASR